MALATNKKNCIYFSKPQDISVKFTAFKTFLKLGVGGKFTKFELEKVSGKTILEASKKAKFKIYTDSLVTGDEERDEKIKKFFFSTMISGSFIKGSVRKIDSKNNLLILTIEMNNEEMDIPLQYSITKNTLSANGIIDMFDWNLEDNLKNINKACNEKHEKKTWNDANIYLKVKFQKNCQ